MRIATKAAKSSESALLAIIRALALKSNYIFQLPLNCHAECKEKGPFKTEQALAMIRAGASLRLIKSFKANALALGAC